MRDGDDRRRPADGPDGQRDGSTGALLRALVRSIGRDVGGGLGAARDAGRRLVRRARRDGPAGIPVPGAAAPGRRRARWLWIPVVAVAPVLLVGAAGAWVAYDLPYDRALAGPSDPVVLLADADGGALPMPGERRGAYTSLDGFPKPLVDAVLAIEDRRFREHGGVDLRGILRAGWRNLSAGGVVEGGSTITQQLVKISVLGPERTFRRKAEEMALALRLEAELDKDEILTRYLNAVYLGSGARGFPAAAEVYFGKPVGDLSVAESALLAGLIRAPSNLSPHADLGAARERAAVVLAAMEETGALAAGEAAAARLEIARLQPVRPASGTWFADWVAAEARALAEPFGGTVAVRTTLDPALQTLAEDVVRRTLAAEGERAGASEAALVAMRPDGAVLAMVGGRDYGASTFNRAAEAKRQPGSTFKLFVAYAALKAGMSALDRIRDAPVEVDGWKPENHSGRFAGRVSMAEAFARSLNAAFVRLAMDLGIPSVAAAARELGIDAELVETPSLALGTSETTLLDLTGAYASVRAGVAPVQPWGIEGLAPDSLHRVLPVGPKRRPEHDLGPLREELIGMLALAVERGTGRRAALDRLAAGKTGTSQNYRDAWFVGFDERLVVGVWVGNDDGAPMNEVTGGRLPAEIWRAFMEAAGGGADAGGDPIETGSTAPVRALAVSDAADPEPAPACDVRACSRAYRSFRASDCTYQPWRGPRKMCTR